VSPQEFGLLFVSILASVAGQFLLKAGALRLGAVNADNAVGHVLGILMVPELIGGLAIYAIGAVSYILLLTRVSLSIAGPAIALTYVFSVMLGHFIFREAISVERLVGLGLIVCGVILVVWQK
jgi:drug/metabolite transporter (DMT)-like permease